MQFTLKHSRGIIGQNLDITVQGGTAQAITEVRTNLDGFDLADDVLNPPSVQYQRRFSQAGTAGLGLSGKLIDLGIQQKTSPGVWAHDQASKRRRRRSSSVQRACTSSILLSVPSRKVSEL